MFRLSPPSARISPSAGISPVHTIYALLCALVGCAGSGAEVRAQDFEGCEAAERFLNEQLGMVAEIGPDTLDDWRTGLVLPACRVTAAGSTSAEMSDAAEGLYVGLFATGWERTPQPRDSPNESSLRLRREGKDCLFSFYSNIVIGTEAELRVSNALVIPPGEKRYNILVQCVRAIEAKP